MNLMAMMAEILKQFDFYFEIENIDKLEKRYLKVACNFLPLT